MLGVRNYTREYIDECRAKVDSDIAAFNKISSGSFEATYFNNMVIVLDHLFVHRLRTVEGKDGNPLNEVRMLCDSIIENQCRLRADTTIKYDPAKSVLKYNTGDEIRLSQADFVRLAGAFFAEIEDKFLEDPVAALAGAQGKR